MTLPSITVVMPAYNAAATIGGSLTSILTQQYDGKVDVVVTDDGSSDGTADIVESYIRAGFPVTLVRQRNAGCGAARTRAMREATGDLVAVVDSDDELLPGFFTTAAQTWLADGGGRSWVSINAFLLTPGTFDPRRTVLHLATPPKHAQARAVIGANFLSILSVFPRAMSDEIGPFDESMPTCEDWDMWARAILSGWPVTVVRTPLALYRWTPGSLSSGIDAMAAGERTVLQHIDERFRDRLSDDDRAFLDQRIAAGSVMELRRSTDEALRRGDYAAARRGYRLISELTPGDRKSQAKALTLGNPVANRFWRGRLTAADAATGRERAGR